MTAFTGNFHDKAIWNGGDKTAISVRDGVLEYLGGEIGQEPADKIFYVYRSPATIANAASKMANIPITDGHVDTDSDVKDSKGSVQSGEVVDHFDEQTDSKLAIRNRTSLADGYDVTGKELSLGYKADLVPHSKYDFEQKNIVPHHLAVVEAGRCGPSCTFIDKKPEVQKMAKKKSVFLDEEGNPSLQQIVEITQDLQEAVKTMTADELADVVPVLQEIVTASGVNNASDEEEVMDEDEDKEDVKVEMKDSAEFKDAVMAAKASAVAEFAGVVEKAKDFVDEAYSFVGKTAAQVMRDAVATEYGKQDFADEELPVVFKMLKHSDSTKQSFGDAGVENKFLSLNDKEL